MCGVATTWGSEARRQSCGGSASNTSRPGACDVSLSIASASAASSISSPRAVLMMRTPFLHFASRSALKRCLVDGSAGR